MTAIVKQTQQFSLAPQTFEEAWRFAKIVADSNFAPKGFQDKPGDVLVAVQMGAELGLAPMQALQSIAVINGRPSIWGDAMVAVCMAHPSFGGMSERIDGDTAYCTVIRKGWPEPVTRTFSMDDAKKAQLLGKAGPWTQYPKRMLQMRARGFALRDAFPDALRGLISQDEARDIPRETVQATVVQNRPVQEPEPEQPKEELSKEAAALQHAIDNPEPLVDPEVDPDDFEVKHGGKMKRLGDLGIPQLEYLFNNGRSERIRAYAEAALEKRRATAPKSEAMDDAQGSWLDGGGEQQELGT